MSHTQSHATWINSSFEGVDESERNTQTENPKALWVAIFEALKMEDGADLLERVREDNLDIVAGLSAREMAEKQMKLNKAEHGRVGFYD